MLEDFAPKVWSKMNALVHLPEGHIPCGIILEHGVHGARKLLLIVVGIDASTGRKTLQLVSAGCLPELLDQVAHPWMIRQ